MGRGDFFLYKNSERHFEVRHLSFITNYDVTYLMHLCLTVMFVDLELQSKATLEPLFFFKPLLLKVIESLLPVQQGIQSVYSA